MRMKRRGDTGTGLTFFGQPESLLNLAWEGGHHAGERKNRCRPISLTILLQELPGQGVWFEVCWTWDGRRGWNQNNWRKESNGLDMNSVSWQFWCIPDSYDQSIPIMAPWPLQPIMPLLQSHLRNQQLLIAYVIILFCKGQLSWKHRGEPSKLQQLVWIAQPQTPDQPPSKASTSTASWFW